MAAIKITDQEERSVSGRRPEGSIELVDADGNKYDLTASRRFLFAVAVDR